MIVELIQTLYHYSAWANLRILDTAAKATAEQFMAEVGVSYSSLRDTLVHVMSSQWMWLNRWTGTSPRSRLEPAEYPDLASVRARWGEIEANTQLFLSELTPAQLGGVVNYLTIEGEPRAYPLWQLMLQQVNHATQHRSEAAVMLTQFGHSPGDLDFVIYLRQQT
ncbi:MAG TPA: DinB family protein [Anaerolineales bacterium]